MLEKTTHIYYAGNMKVTHRRQFLAHRRTRFKTSPAHINIADSVDASQRSINCNYQRLAVMAANFFQSLGEVYGMNGLLQGSVNWRCRDQALHATSYQRSQAITRSPVGADTKIKNFAPGICIKCYQIVIDNLFNVLKASRIIKMTGKMVISR